VLVEDPVCLGEPDTVDDRGVVELVTDDDVALLEQRAEDADVDGVSALERRARPPVRLNAARRTSSSSWTDWVPAMVRTAPVPAPHFPRPSTAGLDQTGWVFKARDIVGCSGLIRRLPAIVNLMPLGDFQDAERVVETLGAELVEVGGERPGRGPDGVGGARPCRSWARATPCTASDL